MLNERKGFTLVELTIAIALFAIVILVVCGVFSKSLQGIKKGQQTSTVFEIANKKLDEVKRIDMSDPDGILIKSLYTSIEGYDPPTVNIDDYILWDTTGEITITGKEGDRGEFKFTVIIKGEAQDLKRIHVEVVWNDEALNKKKTTKLESFLARKSY
jgi:prepilin-type N-terminal cleavage/methylation domain-containing protein